MSDAIKQVQDAIHTMPEVIHHADGLGRAMFTGGAGGVAVMADQAPDYVAITGLILGALGLAATCVSLVQGYKTYKIKRTERDELIRSNDLKERELDLKARELDIKDKK